MLGCRSIDPQMDENTKLLPDQRELLENVRRYIRLTKKLNNLTMTSPGITFAVSVVSQFLSVSRITHLEAVMMILRYVKKTPGRGLLYSDYGHQSSRLLRWRGALLIGGRSHDIVSFWWKSCVMKKQKTECDLSVQRRVRVYDNEKCEIRANMDHNRFIDID